MSERQRRVAVITGSTREGRFGPDVARWFTGRAAERDDVEVDAIETARAADRSRTEAA